VILPASLAVMVAVKENVKAGVRDRLPQRQAQTTESEKRIVDK
jgi:hypothetical protein